MADRRRKLERIRRAQEMRPIVAVPSGEDRTAEVVAWCRRLLARVAQSGGGSAP